MLSLRLVVELCEVNVEPKMSCPDSEKEFLRRVMLANGTFKTTEQHRLDDLNEFTIPFIRAIATRPLRIMDVAVSSGSTTSEWRAQLSHAGIAFEIVATDKTPFAYRTFMFPGITALVDKDRNPMHFTVYGRGVSPRLNSFFAPVKLGLRLLLKARCRSVENTPKVQFSYSSNMPVEEDDLLAPNPARWIGSFDVIRAANILNEAYFAHGDLRIMAATLRQRLRDGGLLIVSRTRESDDKNTASSFHLKNGALMVGDRLNGGSEVEHLITESTPETTSLV
jgi:chemotaxis methyl-accepting protein methylase